MGKYNLQQVFIEESQILNNDIIISGEDARHLGQVLRMRPGEKLRVSCQSGESFLCSIAAISQTEITCNIIERNIRDTELSGKITLFQAIPKGDRLDAVVQKAVELGVSDIYPVAMDFCVSKWEDDRAQKKVRRYQSIADAAAKQSKRSAIPVFHSHVEFDEAVRIAKDSSDIILMPYEREEGSSGIKSAFENINFDSNVAIFIGPEGGFSEREAVLLKEVSTVVSLGKRILRTDTAAILAVGMVMLQMEMSNDIS